MHKKKCSKLIYSKRGKAKNEANRMALKHHVPYDAYFCQKCKGWHVGRSNKAQLAKVKKTILKENDAVLGIDAGQTGALALICGKFLEIHDFKDILTSKRILKTLQLKFSIKFCVLEKCNFRPNERDVKTTEKLIRNEQVWETLLVLNKIDYERYSPKQWRKGLVSQSGNKERFIKKAIKLFPFYEKEFYRHDRAEATLMAHRAWLHINAGWATRRRA